MKLNLSLIAMLVVLVAWPPIASARNKKHTPRATIESMQALPCGAKQRGLAGLGSIFGGNESVFTTRRGIERMLFQFTIGAAAAYLIFSLLVAKFA